MQKHLLVILSVLCATLLYAGCSNSMDDMIGTYNGVYTGTTTQVTEEYTVDSLQNENMLRDSYAVFYRTTFCLTAPSGATKYVWTAIVGENANEEKVGLTYDLKDCTKNNGQSLVMYIPTSPLKRWSSYTILLTVTKPNGMEWEDHTTLYIY